VVIPLNLSELDVEVFFGLCPLSALVFGGGPTSDPPAAVSRFPSLGNGVVSVVLLIALPVAAGAAEVAAAAKAASTMVVGLSDTACASQSETKILDVVANVGSRAKGDSPFIYVHA
jgi:hypothetical protein